MIYFSLLIFFNLEFNAKTQRGQDAGEGREKILPQLSNNPRMTCKGPSNFAASRLCVKNLLHNSGLARAVAANNHAGGEERKADDRQKENNVARVENAFLKTVEVCHHAESGDRFNEARTIEV